MHAENDSKLRGTSVDRLNDGCNNFVQQAEQMLGVDVDVRCIVNLTWIDLEITTTTRRVLSRTHTSTKAQQFPLFNIR